MTKELVKSENGHKIIKHTRHESTHSLFSGPRIKMGFTTPCLIILFLAVAAGDPTSSPAVFQTEGTTEDVQLKPSTSTDQTVSANRTPPLRKNDDNDVAMGDDDSMDDLMLFESLLGDGIKIFEESSERTEDNKNVQPSDIDADATNPADSKIPAESEGIRRQGEVNREFEQDKPDSGVQFDDAKQEVIKDSSLRFGDRSRIPKQKFSDETPFLQLTQGGYDRPFKRSRFRNRPISRPDSSEKSEKVIQESNRGSNNRQPAMRRIVPQVTYSAPPQVPYNSFRPGPIMRPAFDGPARNVLAINHIMPTTVQNGFLNTPPAGFTDYTNTGFQAQFPTNNDVGSFPNFGTDPNNIALYQASQRNPFQDTRVLFQGTPHVQSQPILIDSARNVQPQFQPNIFSAFPNFLNEDNSRPNYAAYFRSANTNPQFQVPPNFYDTNPNTFNNPPISFMSNYPNSDERLPSQFLRYPVTTDAQNQQNTKDQQTDSDASQEDRKTNAEVTNPENGDDPSPVPFGTRLQNEGDVYIRYPTNEAGYAIEENLPPQNNSKEGKDSDQHTISAQNFPNTDPYSGVLNPFRGNQRRNNTFDFPPVLFRDDPRINFGYQRPPNQILLQHPSRNRGLPRFPSSDFNPRRPFDPLTPSTENNYQFLNADNQRRGSQEFQETPTCAKENNASICFEDNEYPRNDILYFLNSNSFLADRLSGPQIPMDSIALVERNASDTDQVSENYACTVDTRYGSPLRAKNLAGAWRVIVSIQGRFMQPVRLEVCRSLGDPCSYADSRFKTTCVQKYSLQRLLTWSPDRGIYSDMYKLPIACSCQLLQVVEA